MQSGLKILCDFEKLELKVKNSVERIKACFHNGLTVTRNFNGRNESW
jgi:hypothetical protein